MGGYRGLLPRILGGQLELRLPVFVVHGCRLQSLSRLCHSRLGSILAVGKGSNCWCTLESRVQLDNRPALSSLLARGREFRLSCVLLLACGQPCWFNPKGHCCRYCDIGRTACRALPAESSLRHYSLWTFLCSTVRVCESGRCMTWTAACCKSVRLKHRGQLQLDIVE